MKKLIAVRIGSATHLKLIRAGYRTHHVDGGITYLGEIGMTLLELAEKVYSNACERRDGKFDADIMLTKAELSDIEEELEKGGLM